MSTSVWGSNAVAGSRYASTPPRSATNAAKWARVSARWGDREARREVREKRPMRLSIRNEDADGSGIGGFVTPLTGQRFVSVAAG